MKLKTIILTTMIPLILVGCDGAKKENITPKENKNSSANKEVQKDASELSSRKDVKQMSSEAAIKNIEKTTVHFSTGTNTNDYTKKLFVFFDPQCPHCANLWKHLQDPSLKDINVVWIPVSVLNDKSAIQSSVLLSQKNPVSLLNEHEELMFEKKFDDANNKFDSLSKNLPKGIEDDVQRNTQIFISTGATGVPLVLKLSNDKTKVIGAPGELSVDLLNNLFKESGQFATKK